MRGALLRSRSAGRLVSRLGCSRRRPMRYPPDRSSSTRTMRAGVSGWAVKAASGSNGNATQTRAATSQGWLRRISRPPRDTLIVWVSSSRMPSGPCQRTRAGSCTFARVCFRNSANGGAPFVAFYPNGSTLFNQTGGWHVEAAGAGCRWRSPRPHRPAPPLPKIGCVVEGAMIAFGSVSRKRRAHG